jgi:hypothetical protein
MFLALWRSGGFILVLGGVGRGEGVGPTPYTGHNTPIYILSTAHQLRISQKTLGTLPEDGIVMPKCVGATIHN